MGTIKYAIHIPANDRPPTARTDQNTMDSSLSFLRAIFTARYIPKPPARRHIDVKIPAARRTTLSGIGDLILCIFWKLRSSFLSIPPQGSLPERFP